MSEPKTDLRAVSYLALASPDPSSEMGPPSIEEDDEITEVFESDDYQLEDAVDKGVNVLDISLSHRSHSVGGHPDLSKRFRNWSGTPTSSTEVSPFNNRRLKNAATVTFQSLDAPKEDLQGKFIIYIFKFDYRYI